MAGELLGTWQGAPPAWRGDGPRLVVVPFAAYDYDGYQAVYARRLAEMLATRLHATGAVEAAFPLLLGADRAGQPDYAMLSRLPEPEQVRALCAPSGAGWAVFGRLNLAERLEWDIFLLDLRSGELPFGDQAAHEPGLATEALTVLALQVVRGVGVTLDEEARSRLFEGGTREPDALRAYLLAADLLGHPQRTEADVTGGLDYAVRALSIDPAFHPPADLVIAEAVRRLGGEEDAAQAGLRLLRRLTEVAPDYHKVPAAVGGVWQRGGDHAQAARAFREALRLSPGHPYYLFRLGFSLDRLDDPEALPMLEEAVAADPANVAAQDLLGAWLANDGRLEEARALWARQVERDPQHAPALTNLGAAAEAAGDDAAARRHYAAATRADPEYAPAFDRYAELAARAGEYTRATELLERLAVLHPDDPVVLDRLARALAGAGRPEQELATLRRLTEVRPDYWPAHYAIAARQRTLGRREEAMTAYERVLERNPEHLPTLIDLGVLLGGLRRLSEASAVLGRAHTLAPDEPNAAYNYAVIQMERGQWEQAEALLRHVKALAPDDVMPDRVLAEIARRRQRGY